MTVRKSTCARCSSDQLSAYIDGMLDGRTMRLVARHLAECVSCQTEVKQLEATRDLLSTVKEPTTGVSTTFWADTYRMARLSKNAPKQTSRGFGGLVQRGGLLVGTAGAALILAMALLSTPTAVAPTNPVSALAADQIDVTSLVSAHANYIAGKHLVDGSNNRIIRSDAASLKTGDPSIIPTDLVKSEPLADAMSY